MLKSKFRLWALLILFPTIVFTWLLYIIFSKLIFSSHDKPPPVIYLVITILLFTLAWLVFGELRTKAISVLLDNNSIMTSSFFGLGFKRQFALSEFDGFTTSS